MIIKPEILSNPKEKKSPTTIDQCIWLEIRDRKKTIKNLPTFRGHLEAENNEFLIRLQKAFVKFSDREDANVREMIERDSPRIRERVLWEMFHLAPSNPVNEVLPSAFALKEEKIHLLETMKNSAI